MPKRVGFVKCQGAAARDLLVIFRIIVHQDALAMRRSRGGLPKLWVNCRCMRGREPSDIICTTEDVMISKSSLGASRKTTTIGGIKGTSLLKALLLLWIIRLLANEVVKLHIRINKGAKRRS
jgi:hypothetical protein